MDEALAFVGETGPYVQNAVVRARSIFRKMAEAGHDVPALVQRAAALDLEAMLAGEEGDEIWGLLSLMARTDEVLEQAIATEEVAVVLKHTYGIAQAYHSYFQKPKFSVLHAESEDRRALRTFVVDAFCRQMQQLMDVLGMPIPDRM